MSAPAESPKRSSLPSRLPNDCFTGRPGSVGVSGLSFPSFVGSRSTSEPDPPGGITSHWAVATPSLVVSVASTRPV